MGELTASMAPKVIVLTTGGTIGHRSQGGVAVMDFEPSALTAGLGLGDLAVEFVPLFAKGSMDIVPTDWLLLADKICALAAQGASGIVILHGTDTMAYTAAALSFVLCGLGLPVVLTGSMRPGGDPDSDASANLRDAICVAASAPMAEVAIVFSADRARSRAVIIRGTRARKLHSFAIDAFDSVNAPPLGYVRGGAVDLQAAVGPRRTAPPSLSGRFAEGVALVKLTPAVTADGLARCLQDAPAAVLEGTGVGHIRSGLHRVLTTFAKPVIMSTQSVYGGERLGMYEADRAILAIPNLIPGGDMTSEAALVKLMWALTLEADVRTTMHSNIAGEIGEQVAAHKSGSR